MSGALGMPHSTGGLLFDPDGVDRVGQADALTAHGAAIVVRNLAELLGRT